MKPLTLRTLTCLAGLLLLNLSVHATLMSSITQYGITWTFSTPADCGQYVTGDWWVVGPVVIQSVSPAPSGTTNGTMVNPLGGQQSYDARGGDYVASAAISFPYTLQPGQSMVSSVSKPAGAETLNVGDLQSQAVLTAVTSAPAAGTFRPAYAGTYKQSFNISQINWAVLPNLAPPSNAPNGADLVSYGQGPRIDLQNDWTIQHSCAQSNWASGGTEPCYGRDYSNYMSIAACYVLLNTPHRDSLAERLIQIGIDNYGALKAGTVWPGNGGHASGRMWPIVFASLLLNDPSMKNVGVDYAPDGFFGEDDQTYYGVNGIALFGVNGDATYFLNGCTGSGAKDARDPAHLVDGCPDYRNCCTSPYWVGQMLSALMINGKPTWNHNAYFDYVDRWMSGGVANDPPYFNSGSSYNDFVDTMWARYRNHLPAANSDTIPPTSPTTLTAGNIDSNSVTLTWSAATDNVGVEAYYVYQNGILIGEVTGTTMTVTGLTPGTGYSFYVVAKDAAGNASPASNTVKIVTTSAGSNAPDDGVLLYPNPAFNNEFYIDFGKANYGKSTVDLIDLNGTVVYECVTDGSSRLFHVSFTTLANGVYGVRIANGGAVIIRKLAVIR